MEYLFSQVVVKSGKRMGADGCTEYFQLASQLMAVPGKKDTYQIVEIQESKPENYAPTAEERLQVPLLRVKPLDLYARFFRGVSEETTQGLIANYAAKRVPPAPPSN